jgi:imidazolonepropionase
VHSANEVLTMAGGEPGPLSGAEQGEIGLLRNGAVAIARGRIMGVGPSDQVRRVFHPKREIDATGCTVIPGLIDAHTHMVFAATREDEFEKRCLGATYQEIAAAGGGIRSSVRSQRAASDEALIERARSLRRTALLHGTTTVEIKSGYGLTLEQEVRSLAVASALDVGGDIVPTFLGAHAVPPEFDGDTEGYVRLLIGEMIPTIARRRMARFCDVFCERGYFNLDQSRRILVAAKAAGFGLRMHADELSPGGGAELAAELGCVTADHLLEVSEGGIQALARAGTIAVLLPGTSFFLGMMRFAPARRMIELGVPLALATDCNPGSSMLPNLQQAIAIGCIGLHLTAAEALVATTRNAAHSLGLGHERGALVAGLRADLVVLDLPTHKLLPYAHGVNHASVVMRQGEVVE